MSTLPNIVDEVNRLVGHAQQERLNLRLIGGLAVRMHSPNMEEIGLKRDYPDIDFVVHKNDQRRLAPFFAQMGYEPDQMFNALNGARRQIYYDSASGRHIDIFVGDFEMCHKLKMRDRLAFHPVTVPLAELFLTKIQIVEMNKKDALDLLALLLNNPLGHNDDGVINLDRIARLTSKDWGWYTTTMMNLGRLEHILHSEDTRLTESQVQTIEQRIEMIRQTLKYARKGFRWQVRSRIGKRLRWYTEVEEVNR
ncbi:MAG: hypothetical protein ACKOC5_15365 [Chloroflexota bacterium]